MEASDMRTPVESNRKIAAVTKRFTWHQASAFVRIFFSVFLSALQPATQQHSPLDSVAQVVMHGLHHSNFRTLMELMMATM